MERAHAPPADRVSRHVQRSSKVQCLGTIHDLVQGLIVNVAQRRMEKAGSHIARGFNHGRNPRGVTVWCDVRHLTEMSAEVKDDAA